MSEHTSGDQSKQKLTGQQIADAGLDGWALLAEDLRTRITTKDFVSALQIVNAIGEAAEEANHHPDLDLRWGRVDVRLSSHDVGGITSRDLALAGRINTIAAAAGARVSCSEVSRFDLGLDAPAYAEIAPFWAAVLAMRTGVLPDEIVDPAGALPLIWFQESGREEPRQRWHPDVWVDPAQVQPRIDAALAAGGSLVSDQNAPAYWVLADPDGNRVCLCTWQSRG